MLSERFRTLNSDSISQKPHFHSLLHSFFFFLDSKATVTLLSGHRVFVKARGRSALVVHPLPPPSASYLVR